MTQSLTLLVAVNVEVLGQMTEPLSTLPHEQYALRDSDGSIGQHTRHIIEFYECFSEGLDKGLINYDARRRNPLTGD